MSNSMKSDFRDLILFIEIIVFVKGNNSLCLLSQGYQKEVLSTNALFLNFNLISFFYSE